MSDQVSLKEFRNSIRQQILKTRRAISEDDAIKAGLKVTETLKDEAFFKQEQRLVDGSYVSGLPPFGTIVTTLNLSPAICSVK